MFLLAGKSEEIGVLPNVTELAWMLRSSVEEVNDTLLSLAKAGIVREKEPGQWFVSNFEKRQYSESYERVKR
jgi:DNA-binding GntR family transcriptional regulator